MKFTTNSEEETVNLGEKLGKKLVGGEFIVLLGELGGGKTRFTKGIAKGLEVTEEVVSPTFTIERIYEGRLNLHHFDFYRLSLTDQEICSEVKELRQDSNNVIVIEWPENQAGILPDYYLQVNFNYTEDDKRELKFLPRGEKYQKVMGEL